MQTHDRPGRDDRCACRLGLDVPEPEIGLVLGKGGATAGYTIGNDVSSREIEGPNDAATNTSPPRMPDRAIWRDGQALTAPTSSPRAIRRSSAIASAITGRIMIMISTDMYHHCGPRVAFCAATLNGMV